MNEPLYTPPIIAPNREGSVHLGPMHAMQQAGPEEALPNTRATGLDRDAREPAPEAPPLTDLEIEDAEDSVRSLEECAANGLYFEIPADSAGILARYIQYLQSRRGI